MCSIKIITNQPPTGNISFTTPIYQNDIPTFAVAQSDSDGNVLTITINGSFNGGAYATIVQWTSVLSGSLKNINIISQNSPTSNDNAIKPQSLSRG
jgi:hypothetical protein